LQQVDSDGANDYLLFMEGMHSLLAVGSHHTINLENDGYLLWVK
jgi:hypothetical protein